MMCLCGCYGSEQVEELLAQVKTQSDADDHVMTFVNDEVEKWKV